MPDVSIIVPAYNPGPYLVSAVDSVIAQTFTDWEMIIIDDGSTEDISPIAEKHEAIRIIRQKNMGLSIARNVGILNSTGKYIAFLDADDVWAPTKLEKQIRVMEADPAIALCHTDFDVIDEEGHKVHAGFARQVESYEDLLVQGLICISMTVVRRDCLAVAGLFDTIYQSTQDYDMWLKIARQYKTFFIPSCEGGYRRHAQNMSGNYWKMYSEGVNILQKHILLARSQQNPEALAAAWKGWQQGRIGFGCQAFAFSRQSLQERDFPKFWGHLMSAFRLAPRYTVASVIAYLIGRRNTVK